MTGGLSANGIPAGWDPDPFGRHQLRYWDGTQWTDQVSDYDVPSTDEPDETSTTPGAAFSTRRAPTEARVQRRPNPMRDAAAPASGKNSGYLNHLPGNERAAVMADLLPGEAIVAMIVGVRGQSLVVTDARVLVVRTGMPAQATLGDRVTAFAYADISGLEVRTGLAKAVVEILSPGLSGVLAGGSWATSNTESDPFTMPNRVRITKAQARKGQQVWTFIREMATKAKSG